MDYLNMVASVITFAYQSACPLYTSVSSFQFPWILVMAIFMFFANVVTPSGKYSDN
jgi:hypothetical protein